MPEKKYNDEGFLVDEKGTHGLAGSLYCPCHNKNCNECCPCRVFTDCKECVEYYKTHKAPEQLNREKIRNDTLDEVVKLIEDLGWCVAGWGHIVNAIDEKLRSKEKYYPVSENEMKIIRYTCFHPDGRPCMKCEHYDLTNYACKFDTKNFMNSIIKRETCKNEVKNE